MYKSILLKSGSIEWYGNWQKGKIGFYFDLMVKLVSTSSWNLQYAPTFSLVLAYISTWKHEVI